MELQRLDELLADAIDRIEAARRILKDHGDARAAHRFKHAGRRAHEVATLEQDLAADTGTDAEQAERGEPGHALARARFAHQPDRLAALNRQVDAVQGADDALAGVEIDGQATDVDQRYAHETQRPPGLGQAREQEPAGRLHLRQNPAIPNAIGEIQRSFRQAMRFAGHEPVLHAPYVGWMTAARRSADASCRRRTPAPRRAPPGTESPRRNSGRRTAPTAAGRPPTTRPSWPAQDGR